APHLLPARERGARPLDDDEHERGQRTVELAREQRPVDSADDVDHEPDAVHLLRRGRQPDHESRARQLDAHHAHRRAEADAGRRVDVRRAHRDQDAPVTRARSDEGFAMLTVLGITVLLVVLATALIDVMQGEASRSRLAVKHDAAYQAAEAGVDDYISKLIDDRLYYVHFVHPGEATRRSTAS